MMDPIKPKKAPRPPPRLRTKTGCYKCRERRKKCDERRPICGACDRLQTGCVYRDPSDRPSASPEISHSSLGAQSPAAAPAARPTPNLPMLSPRDSSLWLRPRALRTEQDWNVFQYCSTKFLNLLISPDAMSQFRDVSFVFAIGFDEPWVMHAALAPAALHASCASLIPKEDAMMYTQSALQGLRQALKTPQTLTASSRESFLAASLFLGVFEDFYSSPSSQSLTHYRAIAQVLEEQTADIPRLDLAQLSVFHRTLLDSVLYHFSTRLIFERDIDLICSAFPAQTMAKYLEALEAESRDPRRISSILPVLGTTPPALFLQIYQITWLSRQVPFDTDGDYALALQCLAELESIQASVQTIDIEDTVMSATAEDVPRPTSSDIAAQLYILATRIYVLKVLDPKGVSSDLPQICDLLAGALGPLSMFDGAAPCGQFICWPVLILGCAACSTSRVEATKTHHDAPEAQLRSRMRALIQSQLLQIWKISYSGYVRRTAGALEKIWSLPTILIKTTAEEDPSPLEIQYDGLNALISKNGLGQYFLSSDVS